MRDRMLRVEPTAPEDEIDAVLARPAPRRAVVDRCAAWIAWFGLGRLLGGAVATAVVVGGAWWLVRTPVPPTEAMLPRAVESSSTGTGTSTAPAAETPGTDTTTATVAARIVVHVAGAVADPGVHELPAGARVADAIRAAGGTVDDATPDALNLAAVLADAARVYVPRAGEDVPPTTPPTAVDGTTVPAGPVDLNRAGVAQLEALPGIGPATAAAIVEHRDSAGPFAAVDDLLDVRGIGPAKLDAIRALVTT